MKFGGKCFLGRVVPTRNDFLEMEMDVMRKSLSRCVAQGLSLDLSLTLIFILVLILCCVLVLTRLLHFIIDRGKGLIAIRLFEFSHVMKWTG